MGDEVNPQTQEPTQQQAYSTLLLALEAARNRQSLAEQGFFTRPSRTCNIEQEVHCFSSQTGLPVSAEALVAARQIPSLRFDTVTSILEYDAGEIAPLEPEALKALYVSLVERTSAIQAGLLASAPQALP